ncbi:carotenoid oxygenase [Hyaloraphidium curvatum]|nr:carotenoid oxygenase [Hyaloraphidium curvatum]
MAPRAKAVSPFLEGNYGPVAAEHDAAPAAVSFGAIPDALVGGQFVRNGPNAAAPPRSSLHWFDSDGMVHGVHFVRDGDGTPKAEYTNRFVRTKVLKASLELGFPVPPSIALFLNPMSPWQMVEAGVKALLSYLYTYPDPPEKGMNTANTSLVFHGGKLLALMETAVPMEISTPALVTIGAHDYGGKVAGFTAHPKVDPESGDMFFFGYDINKPRILYYHADAKGDLLVFKKEIPLRRPAMMHDWAVTKSSCVLVDHPLFFQIPGTFKDLDPAYKPAVEPNPLSSPILFFDADAPTRLGIFPKSDPDAVSWYPIESCAVIHTGNAWDEVRTLPDGTTHELAVLVAPRMAGGLDLRGLSAPEGAKRTRALMHVWVVDRTDGTVKEQSIMPDDIAECEFPTCSPRVAGRRSRYVYAATSAGADGPDGFDGCAKFDLGEGSAWDFACGTQMPEVRRIKYGGSRRGGEPVFVPRNAEGGDEDDGYLVTFVHEGKLDAGGNEIGETELWVMDAKVMEVVCKVKMPTRVPFGFHGVFVDSAQMEMQRILNAARGITGASQPLLDADKERKHSWIRWFFGF